MNGIPPPYGKHWDRHLLNYTEVEQRPTANRGTSPGNCGNMWMSHEWQLSITLCGHYPFSLLTEDWPCSFVRWLVRFSSQPWRKTWLVKTSRSKSCRHARITCPPVSQLLTREDLAWVWAGRQGFKHSNNTHHPKTLIWLVKRGPSISISHYENHRTYRKVERTV